MRSTEATRRSGIGIGPERTFHDAEAVMEQTGVGSLVVIDDDRIVERRGLAMGMPSDARADGIMSAPVVTIDADDDLHNAFALFRTHAVRRLAVIRDEQFVGMITVDDLLMDLATWPTSAGRSRPRSSSHTTTVPYRLLGDRTDPERAGVLAMRDDTRTCSTGAPSVVSTTHGTRQRAHYWRRETFGHRQASHATNEAGASPGSSPTPATWPPCMPPAIPKPPSRRPGSPRSDTEMRLVVALGESSLPDRGESPVAKAQQPTRRRRQSSDPTGS